MPEAPINHEAAFEGEIIDSRRLQMFVLSTQDGGFTSAAQKLSVCASAISHSIKALEDDLGCPLFRRSGPHISLTIEGKRLMPIAKDLLHRMQLLRREMCALDGRTERLHVLIPTTLCGSIFATALSDFSECYPSVNLQIEAGEQGINALTEGTADIVINYQSKISPQINRQILFEETLFSYAAPFHPISSHSPILPSSLDRQRFLIHDLSLNQLIASCYKNTANSIHQSWLFPNFESIRELARMGQGIAILPDWTHIPELDKGTLCSLKLPGHPMVRTCYACWDETRPLSWVGEVFLNLISMAFRETKKDEILPI